jgi:hypothetical protein
MLRLTGDLLKLIWWVITGFFRSRAALEAEIVALRHQLNVLRGVICWLEVFQKPRRFATDLNRRLFRPI